MLEFYYDFLDKYLDRKDYQYIEMDTDSADIAIAGKNLEELVRPHLKYEFYQEWHKKGFLQRPVQLTRKNLYKQR